MDDPHLFYFVAGIFVGLIILRLVKWTTGFMDWLADFQQWRREHRFDHGSRRESEDKNGN